MTASPTTILLAFLAAALAGIYCLCVYVRLPAYIKALRRAERVRKGYAELPDA